MNKPSPAACSAGLAVLGLACLLASPVACTTNTTWPSEGAGGGDGSGGQSSSGGVAMGADGGRDGGGGSLADAHSDGSSGGGSDGSSQASEGGSDGGSEASDGGGGGGGGDGGFTLGQAPFAPSSSWNAPVPANATFTALNWPTNGYYYGIGWDSYSAPIFVSSPNDPIVAVDCPASWGWPAGPFNIHIPMGATGAPGTDGEILIIDGTTVHNFWQFQRTNNTSATAQAYGAADVVTGTGWGTTMPFRGAGILAAGSSELAGMIVQAETDAGDIHHALQLEVGGNLNGQGFTGDAISGDGPAMPGIIIEGELVAIPPSVTMPAGLSPLGQKVFRALQTYGAFDIDTTDCCTMAIRAQQNGYDQATINALDNDIGGLIQLLQKVN